MSEPKQYVKHKEKGEVFEKLYDHSIGKDGRYHEVTCVLDRDGYVRYVLSSRIESYEPEEEWEDIPGNAISHYDGYLAVWDRSNWHPVPSPYTRTIMRDGKLVVQRRKGS